MGFLNGHALTHIAPNHWWICLIIMLQSWKCMWWSHHNIIHPHVFYSTFPCWKELFASWLWRTHIHIEKRKEYKEKNFLELQLWVSITIYIYIYIYEEERFIKKKYIWERERFSDPNRSLNHKMERFKIFEVESGSNCDDVIINLIIN